ncbi:bifunctional 4-hydroxy-2-oxoglutarate aldolase/2-dehydro-3-deoxy-phosphogluconate aldolase [Fluviicola sp.]|uniref:bifunctional 4-hydroxy-2-oxoglutarate aldolase/2-dehydro-3-deoxy-phosphogluconate aldolase n=1 Tax=Fluviicola sp. TaxID=1917219 RepID=UPI0031D6B052
MSTQFDIEHILNRNELIPVVTINALSEVDSVYEQLKANNISCIEITLRTAVSWDAIQLFKERYGDHFSVGVGTIKSVVDIEKCQALKVDFLVSPGISDSMIPALNTCGIPFLPGVATPSDIIRGLEAGWKYFKFFPADLFGGIKALKTYGSVFSEAKFCPTGGINEANYKEFLMLDNVLAVGGSWLVK